MTDPQRLLASTYEGDELERELLGSIRNVLPPAGAKGKAWDGIAVQVATVALVGAGGVAAHAAVGASTGAAAQAASVGGTTSAAAAGLPASAAVVGVAAKALTAKAVAGVLAAGLTVGAGGWWATKQITGSRQQVVAAVQRRPAAEARPSLPTAWDPAATVAPCDPAFPTAPCQPVASPTAADAPSRAVDEPRQRNLLALESRMLTEARAQLRSGDARGALSTLDRLQSRSPKGVLVQEREVLTIQVLAALGDTAGAGRRAKVFLDTYPNSPHAPQLRRFAEP